jgi:hypothetical protein
MSPRSSVVPIVAGGTATAAKLLVATLAVVAAYAGTTHVVSGRVLVTREAGTVTTVSTVPASVSARPARATTTTAATGAATGVATGAATAQASRVTAEVTAEATTAATTGAFAGSAPAPGTVTLTAVPGGQGCDRTFRARSLVTPGADGVSYSWRLQRWNPRTRAWQTYMSVRHGFTGDSRVVEFHPAITDNPGLYRVSIDAGSRTHRSRTLEVTC